MLSILKFAVRLVFGKTFTQAKQKQLKVGM